MLGATLWFLRYSDDVASGQVVALKERAHGQATQLCVDSEGSLMVIENDPARVFGTLREAYLAAAQNKQREASQKLTKAADLFRRAGLEMTKQAE